MSVVGTAPDRRREPASHWAGDAESLARDLTAELGRRDVLFDAGNRALYATDASNYRQVPIGVVRPRTKDQVEAAVAICREHGAPLLARGGGTSLAGQCCNVAVILDFSRHMNRVLEIDPDGRSARVEPGAVLDTLRAAAKPHGLTFGPDPATHAWCTLGGMIGNNSCGVHSVHTGRTADNVRELEVLTYDGARFTVAATGEEALAAILAAGGRRGEIHRRLVELRDRYAPLIRERFARIPRRVSGYNLDELLPERGLHVARSLVGSEGTCVTILEATVDLVPSPPHRVLLVVGFADVYLAADHVPEVLEARPEGLEGMDHRLIRDQRKKGLNLEELELLPEGSGWLLVELGGETREEAIARARELAGRLEGREAVEAMRLLEEPEEQEKLWQVRESGLGATARVPGQPDTWPGWEDSAVPPERMGDYMRELRRLLDRHGYEGDFYGHFGDGCLHTRITFDLLSGPGIDRWRAFLGEAAELVVRFGGSLSGEHGDGQARAELLPLQFGEELTRAFAELKGIWDPGNRMNPGKVVDPLPITSGLRLGADHRPWEPATEFRYPDDDFHFSRAALRCVGVGKCRRTEGGTMCPSYMATREEVHSTRGRARLLFEMLTGDPLTEGWRSEAVREALDLCLACKACKHECPVNVDMATYKAELYAHYYRRRLRPFSAYALGLIHWWARAASRAPRLVNAVAQAPLLGRLTKAMAGVAPERDLPAFAPGTFRQRFRRHQPRHPQGPRVMLWPDTFTNHFDPEIGEAAVEALEAAGFRVEIPRPVLCCGRPLYDQGMLRLAKRLLRRILVELREEIRAGVPVVGLEPSCLAVFRDELGELFPHDPDARRLQQQCFTLAELLEKHAPHFEPPVLEREALVHGHCHHQAVMTLSGEKRLYQRMGLESRLLDSGCCGMAGSFGYEAEKYEVSIACAERVLLPAVREAGPETLLLTDGFSCREQIGHGTERRALHTAQVLQMALREGRQGPAGPRPERGYAGERALAGALAKGGVLAGAVAAAAGLVAGAAWAVGRLLGRKDER
jgi:FAD/FMN-containing dehydrogenase/Fe-S oxidoreductase